jgi:CBS domain-containing protein
MGEQDVRAGLNDADLRRFVKNLLNDLRALESMIERGMIESGVRRIGAEMELVIVDSMWLAKSAESILDEIDDPDFTTELARFNIEFNTEPLTFGGGCLRELEEQLRTRIDKARAVASRHDANILLVGILPSLRKSDLGIENMTPMPRYHVLNEAMTRLRGQDHRFQIKGLDEFQATHDSVMLEACNTSFQVHFQVGPEEFAKLYNVAQAVTAPVIAASTFSPLLFGKRLWKETRIALFQQSVDTRQDSEAGREVPSRVSFGTQWVRESILEIFKEDIARFRVLMSTDLDEDPFQAIADGRPASLKSLRLHNGTIYRWNRPCYGIGPDGTAHIRIENRVMPAGPTPLDATANAAFFFGLMSGVLDEYGDISQVMNFDDAKRNFVAAAQLGLDAQFTWIGEERLTARDLICDRLVPLARRGLTLANIDDEDIDRYLGVIEARTDAGMTGADWMLRSLAGFKGNGTNAERMAALTAAIHAREKTGEPVHTWSPAALSEGGGWAQNYLRVDQLMSTDVFTVHEDELLDLVAALMDWNHIRHVPVEDDNRRLVGLVSHRCLLKLFASGFAVGEDELLPVRDIMIRDVITITPETLTADAIHLMRRHGVACLPVVHDDRIVGIVTERDFMQVAGILLEQHLRSVN